MYPVDGELELELSSDGSHVSNIRTCGLCMGLDTMRDPTFLLVFVVFGTGFPRGIDLHLFYSGRFSLRQNQVVRRYSLMVFDPPYICCL